MTSAAISSSEGGISSYWSKLTEILRVAFGNLLHTLERKEGLEESLIFLFKRGSWIKV